MSKYKYMSHKEVLFKGYLYMFEQLAYGNIYLHMFITRESEGYSAEPVYTGRQVPIWLLGRAESHSPLVAWGEGDAVVTGHMFLPPSHAHYARRRTLVHVRHGRRTC